MLQWQQQNTAIMAETFSMLSMSRCYNQNQLEVAVREMLEFSRCELLLLEAGSCGRGQFGSPDEGKDPLLQVATKQWQ
jgi:hypothetical protein